VSAPDRRASEPVHNVIPVKTEFVHKHTIATIKAVPATDIIVEPPSVQLRQQDCAQSIIAPGPRVRCVRKH